jgi:hypothetical protein
MEVYQHFNECKKLKKYQGRNVEQHEFLFLTGTEQEKCGVCSICHILHLLCYEAVNGKEFLLTQPTYFRVDSLLYKHELMFRHFPVSVNIQSTCPPVDRVKIKQ